MKVLIEGNPFPLDEKAEVWDPKEIWPANWITINEDKEKPQVVEFKLELEFEKEEVHRLHIAADERYKLYVNSKRIGFGNERGNLNNWFYDTYDITFKEGKNEVVVLVWAAREFAPWAQISKELGLIVAGDQTDIFNTGIAAWKYAICEGISFVQWQKIWIGVGGMEQRVVKDYEKQWQEPLVREVGIQKGTHVIRDNERYLRPAMLPEQIYKLIMKQNFVVEANSKFRKIIDMGDYYCSYPMLRTSGGKGTRIELSFVEALVDKESGLKGQRDQIEGKAFIGNTDRFDICCEEAEFETLWWRAGRFVEVTIETGEEAIEVDLTLNETRYPFDPEWEKKDGKLEDVYRICMRVVQECSHETFMDCPFYEQLMYVGDTRIQALVMMKYSKDHRLVKKAIEMFYESMCNVTFLPNCAFPASSGKTIQSFCLWWVAMIHDYIQYNDELEFVRKMMTGARRVMDMYSLEKTEKGLLKTPPGWDFVDWVKNDGSSWHEGGCDARGHEAQAIFNLQMVHVYEIMAKLEKYVGEIELEQRWTRMASELMRRVEENFWLEERGMFADDLDGCKTSQHAQILALLCDCLSERYRGKALEALVRNEFDNITDIYFKYYLFLVAKRYDRPELIHREMGKWYEYVEQGFSTTPEHNDEETRSDCHAWGAFPVLFL